jgi:hypothetical protein
MKYRKQKMCLHPVSCLARNHFRQSGQAVIETVFVVFMIMWILMFVLQLFQISDKAIFVMTNIQKKFVRAGDNAIRSLDRTDRFGLQEDDDCSSVDFLPGMKWAEKYYTHGCKEEDPPSFPIARKLAAFGGSLQRGSNQYYANHRGSAY